MILKLFPNGIFSTPSIVKHLINYFKVKIFPKCNKLVPTLNGVFQTSLSCPFNWFLRNISLRMELKYSLTHLPKEQFSNAIKLS